jgi:uncharacterized membrane protein HdeD (DUF308 family)
MGDTEYKVNKFMFIGVIIYSLWVLSGAVNTIVAFLNKDVERFINTVFYYFIAGCIGVILLGLIAIYRNQKRRYLNGEKSE